MLNLLPQITQVNFWMKEVSLRALSQAADVRRFRSFRQARLQVFLFHPPRPPPTENDFPHTMQARSCLTMGRDRNLSLQAFASSLACSLRHSSLQVFLAQAP